MRAGWALLLALLLAPLSGCVTGDPEQPATAHTAQFPFAVAESNDLVVMEVALLECPVSDAYINGAMWDFVDETANPARKPLLHANGFRLGSLGPTLPDRLIDLLTSQRNAANIRERRLPAGSPADVPIGPTWTQCRYELKQDGPPIQVALAKANCVLEIVPTAAKDDQTTLAFTPLVRHGSEQLEHRVVQDPDGGMRWDVQCSPSIERYPQLSWDLTVATKEYIVVGTQTDRFDTLGYRTFLHTQSLTPVQRLLLLRVVRAPKYESKKEPHSGPIPLAIQAMWTAVSGGPEK